MKIKYYSVVQDDRYKTLIDCRAVNGLHEFAVKLAFMEAQLSESIEAFRLIYNSDDEKKKDKSDVFTFFKPVLVLSRKAITAFEKLDGFDSRYVIRIESPNSDHVAVMIEKKMANVFDALNSDFDKGSNGIVVYKLALKTEFIGGADIFRLPESPLSVIVSSRFVEAVKVNELRGFSFREIPCS